ncbi:MAG: nucleotidyltransferase family protein [Candidatus Sumerlaeota bacterium]|nr:nucleotidyltransferase family protein [Candidatus Sumerlaeota bacterium]
MLRIAIDKNQIDKFCHKWRIAEFSLFGSVLRKDFSPESDVDVLVSFEPESHWSLLDLVEMKLELETIFGRKVDLLTRRAVEASPNWIRRRAILESAEQVYAA